MRKLFTIALVFVCSFFQISAQERPIEKEERVVVSKSDTLNIYFHQASSKWDPHLYNNQASLQYFLNLYRQLREYSSLYRITDIQIIAGCSPEGLYDYNRILSRNRVKSIRTVIESYVDLPDSLVTERAIGIDWEGLREMALNDPDLPYKKEALEIIDNSPELYINEFGKRMELRKVRLMWRYDGRIWKYMYEYYFPYLRCFNLSIVIKYDKIADVDDKDFLIDFANIEPIEHKLAHHSSYQLSIPKDIEPEHDGRFYFAIKNNLLYDALLTPNIGVEINLGGRTSLGANWMYAWWNNDILPWYHRIYGGDIELRQYFGSKAAVKPLQGWHIGLYGQMLTYDFMANMDGVLQNKWSWSAGLAFGYSVPIRKRLNIDFTLGAGYHWGKYKTYHKDENCYVWESTRQRKWIGPTRLEVSLVWLLGRGNVNKNKR